MSLKAFESSDEVRSKASEILDLIEKKTSHLSSSQLDFFRKWEELITLEEQDMNRFRKELWTLNAREREAKGRCFSSMSLDRSYSPSMGAARSESAAKKQMRIHQYTYRFTRHTDSNISSLLNGHISVGDPVTISAEPDLLALARGFVIELKPREVVVGVDHIISDDYIKRCQSPSQIVFRIDKDELMSGLGRIRDNLAQLFYVSGNPRLLSFVVDLSPPSFTEENPSCMTSLVKSSSLNVNQLQAVEHVLKAKDFALILGMPGTGKTTTVAQIIRTLVQLGKTVLLSSYTHSAVDTILLKVKEGAKFGILRLGNIDKARYRYI